MTVIQGRRAARQLALLALYQLEDARGTSFAELPDGRESLERLIYGVAQSLTLQAKDALERSAEQLTDAAEDLVRIEFEDPENLATPMGTPQQAVPLRNTKETLAMLQQGLSACELAYNMLDVPQLILHFQDAAIREFTFTLIQLVALHNHEFQTVINHYSDDWAADRMIKMDRLILKLALAELLHQPDIDAAVSVNEAVELAKLYSQEESHKFINGLLDKGVLRDVLAGTFNLEAIMQATAEKPVTSDDVEDASPVLLSPVEAE
jgi:transcription antitermination protein NusB